MAAHDSPRPKQLSKAEIKRLEDAARAQKPETKADQRKSYERAANRPTGGNRGRMSL